jgi:hypothetical protein
MQSANSCQIKSRPTKHYKAKHLISPSSLGATQIFFANEVREQVLRSTFKICLQELFQRSNVKFKSPNKFDKKTKTAKALDFRK